MKVRDLMKAEVQSIHREDLLPDFVEAMADQHVTALAVVDKHERIIGVISQTDLIRAFAAHRLEA